MIPKFCRKLNLSILILALLTLSPTLFALDVHSKLWLGAGIQKAFEKNQQWLYALNTQTRFINETHPWQLTYFEGGLGYQLASDKTMWIGYRWAGREPFNGFYQENRLIQQFVVKNDMLASRFTFRSRLEEIMPTNTSQVGLRFRQRAGLVRDQPFFTNVYPAIYDEVFFMLNHPTFLPHTFLGENRVFLGVNIRQSKTVTWEVGYINQYSTHTQSQKQNQMSNILSVNCNFS